MTRYFAQNTPRAGLEHMMMSVPGFQKRGGGMMILSRFCYKPEDVDCRYCLHYRRRSCQVRTCPYIAERLKSGAIEYLDLILEYFGHIPHAGLHKRIQAVEHWSGPDQAVLHTVSVHLRSRFADRVWDDAPPGYLAALYLLASKERLWQPALSALSHDSIDFSCIVSKPHGFAIQDYPIFYSARRLYDLKSPMEAEDLAHPKLVSDLDFHNIIYATMIARYGKAVMDASIVFNTCTQEYEEVIVTEEVYRTYCRTRWNIKDNDQSFFDHEIQTSGMIGSQDGAYENFREFIDAINTPEHIILEQIKKEALYQAISALPAADQALVQGLFFKGQSELDYAREIGVSQPAVHKRKVRILKSLKKLLEN